MVMTVPTSQAKLAAVTTLLLGLVFVAKLPALAHVAVYLGVLAGAVSIIAVLTANRLWFGGHAAARVAAMILAALAFLGQMLNLVFGLPGAQALSGETGPWGALALALEVATFAVLVTDRDRRPAVLPGRSPYAL